MSDPTKKTVAKVIDRAYSRCEVCDNPINAVPDTRGIMWSIHHRTPRAMGGTRRAWVNLPANLLLVCGSGTTGCHGWIESNRVDATRDGFLISSNAKGVVAEDVKIRHARFGLCYLQDDGQVRAILPSGELVTL